MSADGSGAPQRNTDTEVGAGLAAIAAAMQDTRAEEAKARRRSGWGVWIWRGFLITLFLGTMVSALVRQAPVAGDQIARFTVEGVITDDPKRDALLRKIAEEDNVKALIVRINSPGGTTTGGEALYASLREVAESKPVVAVMGEVAASAGYLTAVAADHVIARGNTITASIGVIFTAPNFHELLENVGISVVELKSGVRKAVPSPYTPVDPAALQFERELVDDSFDWFIGLVQDRRGLDDEALAQVRDGRVLTGRLAEKAGLVDAIGGQVEAVDWLENDQGLTADLPVVDRKIPEERQGLFQTVGSWLGVDPMAGPAAQLAASPLAQRAERVLGGPSLMSVVD
ncbi:MAG: signal peptide peptidase SppA [Pseudomonadota bacterium]